MFNKIITKIIGSRKDRLLKKLHKVVKQINDLEEQFQGLSDAELQAKTQEFKDAFQQGKSLDELLPEAFAVVREGSKRVFGMRNFDVQLLGGMILHDNKIAEMRTGEGKTLTATLPAYLNALTGKGVHVITVNDYLAKRDAEWNARLFEFLGLSVGINLSGMTPDEKRAAYAADITYGTNNEFGFDYLRDNMAFEPSARTMRPLYYAIVDEVDSILIDEARTPLIISGPTEGNQALYEQLDTVIPMLERQEKEARAKQEREVANIQAREQSEQMRVAEEERLKAESARITTEQEIAIQEENKLREIEVAQQNRERAIGVEKERVQRAKDLEVVSREREVQLQTIEKERALEVEKKEIANVIRERIVVEKTVAEEEERIKEVREVSEADRNRQVVVLNAEAEAQEELVKQVKQAEADEIKAKHEAQKIITLAQADLEASAKNADAMKKMAEGIEAEQSAPGLAEARVKEALANAFEKEGLAKAKVEQETLIARAQGDEQIGLAKARVLEANAVAKEKDGIAEATVLAEKLSAQAKGDKDIGLAKALASREIGTAEADVLGLKLSAQAKGDKEQGMAEADILSAKFHAEAQGLVEKFSAMATMSQDAREHEEFRMQLEKDFEQAMEAISVNKDIAVQQANVLSSALEKANIDIVGGQGDYFNSLSKALTVGKSINGLVGKSPSVAALLNKFIGSEEPTQEPAKNSSDVLGSLLNEKTKAKQPTTEPTEA